MDIRFTKVLDDEEFETSLEDFDTLEYVIYQMAQLFDASPFLRDKIQNAFKVFGLRSEKKPM